MVITSVSPKKIDKTLVALLAYLELNPDTAQRIKFSKPSAFTPEIDQCHFNVWCQIRQKGGKSQSGWMLAQDKQADFAEAIFHTVWCPPDGKLIDVTPRKDNERRILFVPDNVRAITLSSYDGRPAIYTYRNVKWHRGGIVHPLEQFKAVICSDFPERMGLWPW